MSSKYIALMLICLSSTLQASWFPESWRTKLSTPKIHTPPLEASIEKVRQNLQTGLASVQRDLNDALLMASKTGVTRSTANLGDRIEDLKRVAQDIGDAAVLGELDKLGAIRSSLASAWLRQEAWKTFKQRQTNSVQTIDQELQRQVQGTKALINHAKLMSAITGIMPHTTRLGDRIEDLKRVAQDIGDTAALEDLDKLGAIRSSLASAWLRQEAGSIIKPAGSVAQKIQPLTGKFEKVRQNLQTGLASVQRDLNDALLMASKTGVTRSTTNLGDRIEDLKRVAQDIGDTAVLGELDKLGAIRSSLASAWLRQEAWKSFAQQ